MAVAYGLATFARDLDALVVEYSDDYGALVERAKPLLERLLSDMSWLPRRYYEPENGAEQAYMLHRHPDGAYSVQSMVFPPGASTPVHDHNGWGLVGVWHGEEEEERFTRVDDRARPDYAELRSRSTTANRAGYVTVLVPPDDIHRVRNVTSAPAYSIHVYGRLLGEQGARVFDLETGAVRPWNPPIGFQELLAALRRRHARAAPQQP
jgi:predicted metal-dependent enzyme (double-stranded beta helix superfamily)